MPLAVAGMEFQPERFRAFVVIGENSQNQADAYSHFPWLNDRLSEAST
jgi:hypothetical protein